MCHKTVHRAPLHSRMQDTWHLTGHHNAHKTYARQGSRVRNQSRPCSSHPSVPWDQAAEEPPLSPVLSWRLSERPADPVDTPSDTLRPGRRRTRPGEGRPTIPSAKITSDASEPLRTPGRQSRLETVKALQDGDRRPRCGTAMYPDPTPLEMNKALLGVLGNGLDQPGVHRMRCQRHVGLLYIGESGRDHPGATAPGCPARGTTAPRGDVS
jgi:hypothetical protein